MTNLEYYEKNFPEMTLLELMKECVKKNWKDLEFEKWLDEEHQDLFKVGDVIEDLAEHVMKYVVVEVKEHSYIVEELFGWCNCENLRCVLEFRNASKYVVVNHIKSLDKENSKKEEPRKVSPKLKKIKYITIREAVVIFMRDVLGIEKTFLDYLDKCTVDGIRTIKSMNRSATVFCFLYDYVRKHCNERMNLREVCDNLIYQIKSIARVDDSYLCDVLGCDKEGWTDGKYICNQLVDIQTRAKKVSIVSSFLIE